MPQQDENINFSEDLDIDNIVILMQYIFESGFEPFADCSWNIVR